MGNFKTVSQDTLLLKECGKFNEEKSKVIALGSKKLGARQLESAQLAQKPFCNELKM